MAPVTYVLTQRTQSTPSSFFLSVVSAFRPNTRFRRNIRAGEFRLKEEEQN